MGYCAFGKNVVELSERDLCMDILNKCALCPRGCGVDRLNGKGFCGADGKIKIARCALHMWEEPCISGKTGSGAVFFSHCTMKCAFCQNYKISHGGNGYYLTEAGLADEFLRLQNEGAYNINLVTPSHYAPQIIRALHIAKSRGMTLPVVYNCGGYETVETLKMMDGYVDVYMPDMKYYSDKYAVKYSSAPRYFETCAAAINEMFRQVGRNQFNKNGILTRGVIVRHMLLPGLLLDSKRIMDYLHTTYGDDIYISIMSQYTPSGDLGKFPELNRPIDPRAYDALVDYCAKIGVINAFVQDIRSSGEGFIPDFYEG